MEVRRKYKQTDIGPIPPDWRLTPLGHLVSSVEYGSSAKSSSDGLMPVLRMGNLQGGKIDWSDLVYTSSEAEIRKYALHPGDVLFNRTNTIDLVGKTSIYRGEQPAIFAGYLIRVVTDKSVLDSTFLNYILNTEFARKHSAKVLSIAVGQANINGQKLKTYPIPLPPTKEEQGAIAEALSDADTLIASLTAIIAKKRNVKQGAMQELLTGKKRLPGFTQQWESDRLGDKAIKVGSGITPTGGNRVYKETGRPFIRSQNVGWGLLLMDDVACIDDQTHAAFDSTEIQFDDVLLNITGASIGRSAVADSRIEGGNVNQHVCLIRPRPHELDSHYLKFFLLSRSGQMQIDSFQAGGNRQGLNFAQVRSLLLPLPSYEEQRTIAAILTEMDAECTALENKLAKVRQIKQGMMQELLTGRIRLV